MMRSSLLLSLTFAFLSFSATAADRVLDFSSGCKIYRLDNKAWVPEESATFDGMELAQNQIVKDEKFTVFRTPLGTFGVNQKCVKAGTPSAAPATTAPAARTARPRPVAKRASAAKPRGPSLLDNRGKWAASFDLGLNISPKGTTKLTNTSTGETDETTNAYTGSITFVGEVSYRVASMFRLGAEVGLSQLQESSSTGNETSFIAIRPEIVLRGSPVMEIYFGPTLGLFFLAENASTGMGKNGETLSVKQQTASTALIGAIIGADYAISDQFDIGLSLRYFKPGSMKITVNQTAPTTTTLEATRDASYMTFGGRFQIHF